MKKILLILLPLFLIVGCSKPKPISPPKPIPTEQTNYTQTWKKLLSNKQSADTQARSTKSLSILREHIDQKLVVSDWYGKITEVGTNSILVENNGMKYNLKPKGKNIDYLNFDKGIDILFSGRLIGMGWFASSDNPKIDVECLKITNLGKNEIYFTMTQDEMNDYKEVLEFKEDIKEGWNELLKEVDEALNE